MHGYFVSLKLYETARLITNPFAYQEHRERAIKDKMEKLAETRIRSGMPFFSNKGFISILTRPSHSPAPNQKRADALKGVTVNQALATKILKEEEKERKRAEKKLARAAAKAQAGDLQPAADEAMQVDQEKEEEEASDAEESTGETKNLLTDPRFSALFSNPDYTVDQTSREFAMLNPSSVAQRNGAAPVPQNRRREMESDDEDDGGGESGSGSGSDEEDGAADSDSDSDNEGSSFSSVCDAQH